MPRIRALDLKAVIEGLAKQAESVEDAVAGHGVVLGHGGIEETGSQAAQATVSQCRVIFHLEDVRELLAELAGGGGCIFHQT